MLEVVFDDLLDQIRGFQEIPFFIPLNQMGKYLLNDVFTLFFRWVHHHPSNSAIVSSNIQLHLVQQVCHMFDQPLKLILHAYLLIVTMAIKT